MHKTCVADALGMDESESKNMNKCKTCKKVVLDGLEEALKQPKMTVNKVISKINQKEINERKNA